MISRLEKVTVYVESQADAKKFWTEKLGFVVALEQPMGPNMTWVEVVPKGGEKLTTLVLYPKQAMLAMNPSMVAHPSLMFTTPDVDATHAELKAAGVDVDAVESMPWGKMFRFRDPDKNVYLIRG